MAPTANPPPTMYGFQPEDTPAAPPTLAAAGTAPNNPCATVSQSIPEKDSDSPLSGVMSAGDCSSSAF